MYSVEEFNKLMLDTLENMGELPAFVEYIVNGVIDGDTLDASSPAFRETLAWRGDDGDPTEIKITCQCIHTIGYILQSKCDPRLVAETIPLLATLRDGLIEMIKDGV